METSHDLLTEFTNFNSPSHLKARPPRMAYLYFPKPEEQVVYIKNESSRKLFEGMIQYREFEIKVLKEFNELIHNYNESASEIDKIILPSNWSDDQSLRILQGKEYNIQNSLICLKEHLKWRNQIFPIKITNKLVEILNSGFIYCHGRDNRYRLLVIINPHIFVNLQNRYVMDDWIIAVSFLMDYIIKNCLIPGQVESWMILCDVSETSVVKLPSGLKTLLNTMADNFRCRLYTMYLLNVSFIVRCGWALIKSMLHPATQKKIQVLSKEDFIIQSKNKIHPSQIEKKFGGTAENVERQFFPPICPSDQYMTDDDEIHVSEHTYGQIIQENKKICISPYYSDLENEKKINKEKNLNPQEDLISIYSDCLPIQELVIEESNINDKQNVKSGFNEKEYLDEENGYFHKCKQNYSESFYAEKNFQLKNTSIKYSERSSNFNYSINFRKPSTQKTSTPYESDTNPEVKKKQAIIFEKSINTGCCGANTNNCSII